MPRGPRIFVAGVFLTLGLAFLLSSATIVHEFRDADWLGMLIAHSHLFIFFPTLGILALAAFYVPAVIFTDLYWHRVQPMGRERFAFGVLIIVVLSLYFANVLREAPLRAIWEVAPETLVREQQASGAIRGAHQPILPTLKDLMTSANERLSLTPFARNCQSDPKLERPEADKASRYCFPAGAMLDVDNCCRAQRAFASHVSDLWKVPATRSKAADYDRFLLPFKVFFVIVVMVIGCFLIVWRQQLKDHYSGHLPAIERGIAVGALAMLLWPLMDYGYQQTTDVLFGREHAGIAFRLSLVLAPWAALLLLYLVDLGENSTRVTQFSTVVGSALAVLRYQEINDFSARALGSGASPWHFAVVFVFVVMGICFLIWPPPPRKRRRKHEPFSG